jgi:hypothetical protein
VRIEFLVCHQKPNVLTVMSSLDPFSTMKQVLKRLSEMVETPIMTPRLLFYFPGPGCGKVNQVGIRLTMGSAKQVAPLRCASPFVCGGLNGNKVDLMIRCLEPSTPDWISPSVSHPLPHMSK